MKLRVRVLKKYKTINRLFFKPKRMLWHTQQRLEYYNEDTKKWELLPNVTEEIDI